MNAFIEKGKPCGEYCAKSSKSLSHRMLICAAMAQGCSTIENLSCCDDVQATISCLEALGAEIKISGNKATVKGISSANFKCDKVLECRESASTLRFLIPICALDGKEREFKTFDSLANRPLDVYENLSAEKGFSLKRFGNSVKVCGNLKGSEFELCGNVSSQFISGLLFALPLCKTDSKIKIKAPFESKSYIDLTLQSLGDFGICAKFVSDDTIFIKGNQKYKSADVKVENDYSSASAFLALSKLSDKMKISGLSENSLQGDRACEEYLCALSKGKTTLSLENSIDLAPVLFAFAAVNHGGIFKNIKRLRLKESDRINSMAKELSKFGVKTIISDDSFEVVSSEIHRPCETLCSHNDHRVAMALSVLLTLTGGEIEGAQCVSKSYPTFFDDLQKLGINVKMKDI